MCNHQIMKITTYLLSFFILGLMSCQKEIELIAEVAPTDEEVLLTINLDPNSSNSPGWTTKYVVTTDEGQIIDMHQYVNGEEHIELLSKVKYEGNLSLYEISQSFDYLLISVTVDRKKGTVIGEPYKFQTPAIIENTSFKIKNFPEFDRASYSTSRFVERFESINDTIRSLSNFPYQKSDRFYMQVVKANKGFYNFFEIKPENGLLNIDASKCTIPSIKKEIKLAKNDLLRYGYLYGIQTPENSFPQSLDFFQSKSNENALLFYPEGIFQSYFTSIGYARDYNVGDKIYQTFGSIYKGAIPNNDAPLKVTANIIKPEVTNFEVSFTGNFKYYSSGFSKTVDLSETNSINNSRLTISVAVLSPSHIQTFKLADLSAVIDNFKYVDNLKLNLISLFDYNCDDVPYLDFVSGKVRPKTYIYKQTSIQYFDNRSAVNVNGSLPKLSSKLFDHHNQFMNQAGRNMFMKKGSFDEKLHFR